jgi:hypothetical protein
MPLYQGFCGPSNPSQSLQADCERLVNWYQERVETQYGPTGDALYPVPGTATFGTMTQVEPRALFQMADRCFAVYGSSFTEIFTDGTSTVRGTVLRDANLATISYNGTAGGQLFITSGNNGYCYVLATNVLTLVLTNEATQGGMLNARFLSFNKLTGRVKFSALNDGTSWGATDYFARTLAPDPWQAMVVNGNEIWLIGEQTGEVWYDNGGYPLPYAPIPGAIFKYGTSATFSVTVAGDYVTWLSKNAGGAGSIVAARGYTPQVISNYAVETAIAGYARTSSITDCEVLAYTDQGHQFVCFSFPSANATWCVDLALNMAWAERGKWNTGAQRYDVWGPRVHCYAFGKHLIGLRSTATVATMDVTTGSEADGTLIRRLRIPPPLWASSRQRLMVTRFQLMAEPGLGLVSGQGVNPLVMLRTSTNAKTWGAERTASAGALGDYNRRIVWTRLGSSDALWVPEITVSDPIPWRLSGAEIDGTGFQQAGRAA